MKVDQLGYVVVHSIDVEKWRHFGTQVVGLAGIDGPDDTLYLKADVRAHRILVVPGDRDRLFACGWEVRDKKAFVEVRHALSVAGVATVDATPADLSSRKVSGMFRFEDPSGNLGEVYWGPISDFARFISPVGVAAFVTGAIGMGHVVLPATNFAETQTFWTEMMGFDLSDILHVPIDPDAHASIHFLHCNARQHCLALAEMHHPSNCIHIMLELPNFDEVGYALDRVMAQGAPLASTLGRHVNDDMTSFYVFTPAGFALEIGCGGMVKDWAQDRTVFQTTRGSQWGHHWQDSPHP